MKRRLTQFIIAGLIAVGVFAAAAPLVFAPDFKIDEFVHLFEEVSISPDYTGVTLPWNIAPVNFRIKHQAEAYHVRIYSQKGSTIEISSRRPVIQIPAQSWKKLLLANKGNDLKFDIFVRRPSGWAKFKTIINSISAHKIDKYLVYRTIRPVYSRTGETGVYQRNLESFAQKPVIESKYMCVNCHTFSRTQPEKMMLGIRGTKYGSSALYAEGGRVNKINTRFGYTAWHPSGKIAVFSLNKVRQFFHSVRGEVRDVVDLDSLIAYYVTETGEVKTADPLSIKDKLETFPNWSPDGEYLYYSCGPLLWEDRNKLPPENFEKLKYDIVRAKYDVENDEWGEMETLISAEETNKSMLQPRISPDGRWMLFCMCNYSCWPAYQKSSDLYITDLAEAEEAGRFSWRKVSASSGQSESWHSWSSNSRWVAFSSKRGHATFTRIYLAHVDTNGKFSKPLIVPRRDPDYYRSCLWTIGVGEFRSRPVETDGKDIRLAIRGAEKTDVDIPVTMASPDTQAHEKLPGQWKIRE